MNRKVLGLFLSVTMLLLSAVIVSSASAAWLPPANQDVCWKTSNADILKLRFVNIGGGHYQVVGRLTESDGIINVLVGGAEQFASTFVLLVTSTGSNASDTWTYIGRFVINRTTVSMKGEGMGPSHSKTDPDPNNVSLDYDGSITLTKITCP